MKKGLLVATLATTAVSVMLLSGVLAREPQAAPESEGFSSERLARLGAVLRAEIDNGTLPGAVTLIARHGKVVHFEAYGYLDAGKTKPMPQDAMFRVFSMTKPFVSVVAMMLVEQGRMKLSDPIATWLPEFKDMKVLVEKKDAAGHVTREPVPAERPITLQDLLRHTSGFAYADNAPFPEIKEAYNQADIESRETDVSPDTFVQRLAGIPLAWQPGTRWQYGVSTDVLGVLLERLTGKRLDLLLDEMLFKLLEMKDTSFQVKPDQRARLADALDADPLKARAWKANRIEADPGMRYRSGGSGAVSTAADYFRFAQLLVNGGALDGARLLSRKTVEYMLSDHIPGFPGSTASTTGPGYGFGLGFGVRRQEGFAVVPGSTGDAMWAGFGGTSFTIDPKEQIVGVFMAQAPTPRQHTRFLFKTLLYGALVQ
jgi:CubicO group peptidase (beta-lactamase class C family)